MAQIGDQVDDPGYHLTHIPKGVAGEISKDPGNGVGAAGWS